MRDRERIRNLEVRNLIVLDTMSAMVDEVTVPIVPAPASKSTPTTPGVTTVAGRTGAVVLSTADVGGLASVASSGAYADLSGRPTLATVATTGNYADLSGRPALGTLAPLSPTGTPSASTFLRGDGAWASPPASVAPVSSVAGRTGAVTLGAGDVGGLAAVASSGSYADLAGRPAIPAVVGGKATITGTGSVATGLTTIAGVVACLGQDPSLAGLRVTATWAGGTVSLKVWKPTSALDGTPLASTTATVVNWIALGS